MLGIFLRILEPIWKEKKLFKSAIRAISAGKVIQPSLEYLCNSIQSPANVSLSVES